MKGFEHVFDVMRYPAGESHVEAKHTLSRGGFPWEILCSHVRNFDDLCNVVTANRILKHNYIDHVEWYIPYFPFARHDRRRSKGDGFELGLALDLIRDMQVTTLDPHSDVLGQLRYVPQGEVVRLWEQEPEWPEDPVFVIPDAGATKKAYEWLDGRAHVQAEKQRDTKTGALSGFGIVGGNSAYTDRNLVIVDDICDGGGTFLGLVAALKFRRPKSISLAVTHGLFTKGTDILFKEFDNIFTTGPGAGDGVVRVAHHKIFEGSIKV